FTDAVTFTSTDPHAALPPDTTFTLNDGGTLTVRGAILNRGGVQRLTVTDKANGAVLGTLVLNVTGALPAGPDSLVGRDPDNGQWFAAGSNGSSGFTTALAAGWNPTLTWADVQTGDFNGDGVTDLVGRVQETGQWFVARADGAGHFTTALWDAWNPAVAW